MCNFFGYIFPESCRFEAIQRPNSWLLAKDCVFEPYGGPHKDAFMWSNILFCKDEITGLLRMPTLWGFSKFLLLSFYRFTSI